VAVDPRMPAHGARELGARDLDRCHRAAPPDALELQERAGQRARDHERLAVDLDGRVLLAGVDGDGQVGGQRPGRRRPDDERGAYGCFQSPNTPRRLNSSRWMSMNFSAYSRQRRIFSAGSMAWRTSTDALSRPSSLSTWCSMGSPWQSHPGTYTALRPSIERDFTTKSFRILLSAVPMWMCPLA